MDNLDGFQKLVSTAKDVLDLDLDWSRRRDHQAYKNIFFQSRFEIQKDRNIKTHFPVKKRQFHI